MTLGPIWNKIWRESVDQIRGPGGSGRTVGGAGVPLEASRSHKSPNIHSPRVIAIRRPSGDRCGVTLEYLSGAPTFPASAPLRSNQANWKFHKEAFTYVNAQDCDTE